MTQSPWHLRQRIDEMFEALDRDDRVRVLLDQRQAPITQDEVDEIHRELGWQLDERFLELFRIHNGLRLIWIDARVDLAQIEEVHDTTLTGDEDPQELYLFYASDHAAGSIHIKPLREILFDMGQINALIHDPGEHVYDILGGWDEARLFEVTRDFDDFMHEDDGSFYLPGVVIEALYPDPPVVMGEDYLAGLDLNKPMLARQYVELVIATLGSKEARMRRMSPYKNQEKGPFFLAPPGWLDAMPSASRVLDLYLDTKDFSSSQAITHILTCRGQDLRTSPYASYVDAALRPEAKKTSVKREHVHVISKEEFSWWDYWDTPDADRGRQAFDTFPSNHPMVIPVLDEAYYEANNPMRSEYMLRDSVRTLIGSPIKLKQLGSTKAQMVCLIAVEQDRIWTYRASISKSHDGQVHIGSQSYGFVQFSDIEWLGLALPTNPFGAP